MQTSAAIGMVNGNSLLKGQLEVRAVVITSAGGREVLAVREVATPQPQGTQVRVRVRAAGLNRADLAQRAGFYPAPTGVVADIPGLEFAGEVDAVGPLVRQVQPGQRVMGIVGGGAQAEYVLTEEGLCIPIPDTMSDVQAGGIPEVFITAHDALFTQAGLTIGERVLIHAAGSGVGTAAIQLARAAGATVYGTSRTASKLEQARPLGLTAGFTGEQFAGAVQAATQGAGVHVVLDMVGGSYLAQNIQSLGQWGRMVVLATMGGATAELNIAALMSKRIRIMGSTLRSRTLEEKLVATSKFTAQVVPLLASGQVQPIIADSFALEQIQDAHAALEANTAFGKLILTL